MRRAWYQLRNWRAWWRGVTHGRRVILWGMVGRVQLEGRLDAVLLKADGRRIPLGTLSRRVVTTAGVNFLRDDFNAATGGADVTNMNFHDSGTGVGAEAVGDTDLGTPAGPAVRATGAQSAPAAKQYRSIGTITYAGALAITEHGLFNQAARGAGTVLWDRSVFAAINVVASDAIQFTYTLTINDGG